MKIFSFFSAVVFCLGFSTVAWADIDKHSVQTRSYPVTKIQALHATLSVFQDNLYTDIRLHPEIGLLQAEMPVNLIMDSEGKAITRAVVKEGAGKVLGGIFGGGVAAGAATDAIAGKSESGLQLNRVQAAVEDIGAGKVSVRFVFIRTIQIAEQGGAAGGGQQKTIESDLTDKPEVYEKIFEQLGVAMAKSSQQVPPAPAPASKVKK